MALSTEKKFVDQQGLAKVFSLISGKYETQANVTSKIAEEATARQTAIGTIPAKVGNTDTANVVAYVDAKVAAAESGASADTTYSNENGTTVAVGGIAKGTTFDNMSVKDILENMMYPYVAIAAGSLSMNGSSTVREVGATHDVTSATVSYTKGSKNCTKLEVFRKDGTSIGSTTGTNVASGATVTFTATETVSADVAATARSGSVKYYAKVTDAQGTVKQTGDVTYTFYRPYYYGSVAAAPTDSDGVKAVGNKTIADAANKTITANANERPCYAYPKSRGAIAKIVDSNGFDYKSNFAVTTVSVNCLDGKDVDYYVYVGPAGTASASYTLSF